MNVNSTTNTDPVAVAGSDVANNTSRLANQDVFMKLLVAQLKYQNPMNPADGVEFMSQLTQFTQLEQTMQSRQELTRIRELLQPVTTDGGATAP
jgi:flagellar basal-body rod modification protein FlgD